MVINGGKPFGAEKPDGPVPGGRTGCPSKTSRWDVFESTEAKALGLFLAGARLASGLHFLAAPGFFAYPAGVSRAFYLSLLTNRRK